MKTAFYTRMLLLLFLGFEVQCQPGLKRTKPMALPQPRYEQEFEMPDLATLPPDGGPRFNRLIFESSPYLLQHANNPVDWYPWNAEAFEKAVREDRPIFLSIGYSTCHWCHVMEHESFENDDVAEYLNKYFVAIKVDREERPDIDHVYMTVCQALTGSGGWPLTIFMTPDRKPFFAGTYFPPETRFGRPGFLELLERIHDVWINDREKAVASGSNLVQALSSWSGATSGHPLDRDALSQADEQFKRSYDIENGGFGGAPKFPMGHSLSFLLRRWKRTGDPALRDMALHTLRAMYNGGMYDHLGFGFARYSTDARWLVPHFEKMLYDQALLLRAYTDAYQVAQDPFYARVVREIALYVQRDMTDMGGGFYSAENADSEGKEGKFYTWTKREILDVLGSSDGVLFCRWYGVTDKGNFEDGLNILHAVGDTNEFADDFGVSPVVFRKKLDALRHILFSHRRLRIHPSKDDKILTSWNGLMISSLARAGFVLDADSLISTAIRAADFILANMVTSDNTIFHRWRAGNAGIEGYLEDYAFFIDGLLELYQATFDIKYLEKATQLHQTMLHKFLDVSDGTLFTTAHDAEQLIVRIKDSYDGALPSGNSMAAWNAIRIARFSGNATDEKIAERIMTGFSNQVRQAPTSSTVMLTALDFALGPSREIIIAGNPGTNDTRAMIDVLRHTYLPDAIVVFNPGGTPEHRVSRIVSYLQGQGVIDGKAAAYVCENFTCQLPAHNALDFQQQLHSND